MRHSTVGGNYSERPHRGHFSSRLDAHDPIQNLIRSPFNKFGWTGLHLFFVLSGFLITVDAGSAFRFQRALRGSFMRTAGKYSYAACVWRQHTAHLVYAAEKKAFGKRAAAVSQHPISGRGHLAGLDG